MNAPNPTIELLMRHRSIRKYTDQSVERSTLEQIVSAGQMASSSSHVQAYSVVAVKDPERKRKLAELCGGQAYVEECPVFLVWCADLHRLKDAADKYTPELESHEGLTENFIIATVDAALAAQNAAVAAESLGLGIVYIGGIRNRIAEVSELLELPELVYPVFGMCLGYPDQTPVVRPRLPLEAVLHIDRFDKEKADSHLDAYDDTMVQYISERTHGARDTAWTRLMADKITALSRPHMREYLYNRGFKME
ncbi:NADPH-dependent oxidoreductase [Paenibacillus yonginensis]|uniref:NADPH-dependent oxidoreductase n=1 Tax=Paenibacillus yonginensis TaxID=1462996 RepID=A0A1B1N5Q8_9BACL|nr:oxygen-insensitive NADPH nitroreductase [Paenibacillus yonginensis]ANS76756.1 NADPH-dependent oxidoreductase [Paenibacillus yonginensis]